MRAPSFIRSTRGPCRAGRSPTAMVRPIATPSPTRCAAARSRPGSTPSIMPGRVAALGPLSRRDARARKPISRAHGEADAGCPDVRRGSARRWAHSRASLQLWPDPHPAARRTVTDPAKRPYVVIDPRAGHGPGIGGFKADSEIGASRSRRAIPATSSASCGAGARPDHRGRNGRGGGLPRNGDRPPSGAEGLPVVVGNCQAGWAVTMLAAVRPELFGPIILAGSPLSFWAGHKGGSPMRYMGG